MSRFDLQQQGGIVAKSTAGSHFGNGTIKEPEHMINHDPRHMAPRRLGGPLSIPPQAPMVPFLEASDSDEDNGQTASGIAQQVPHTSSDEKQQQRQQSEILRRAAIDRSNRSSGQPATEDDRLQSRSQMAVKRQCDNVSGVIMPQRSIVRASMDAISASANYSDNLNGFIIDEERSASSTNNQESNPWPLADTHAGRTEAIEQPFGTSTRRPQVTVDDLELLQLRRDGMTFPAIAQRHFGRTGEERSSHTFKHRHNRVRSRIEAATADPVLVRRAQSGDRGALKQLNVLLDKSSVVNRPPRAAPPGVNRTVEKQQPARLIKQLNVSLDRYSTVDQFPPAAPAGVKRVAEKRQPDRPLKRALTSGAYSTPPFNHALATSNVNTAITAPMLPPGLGRSVGEKDTLVTKELTPQPRIEQRKSHGGKTMNWEVFEALLGARTEDTADPMQYSWAALQREESPTTDLDFCHNIYQAQRRHRTAQDAADGVELEDIPWFDAGPAFENLSEANAYASRLARKNLDGAPAIFDGDGDYTTHSSKDEHGRQYVEMCCAAGEIQCRVATRTRAFQEGIAPQSKAGWAPKIVYLVFRRVVTREETSVMERVDELFDEDKRSEHDRETVHDEMMGNNVYTTLRQANQVAIEAFVQAVFRSTSANLIQRQVEQQAELDRVTEDFQRQCNGEDMFRAEREMQRQRVQVRVEKGSLKGPRNL